MRVWGLGLEFNFSRFKVQGIKGEGFGFKGLGFKVQGNFFHSIGFLVLNH